MKWIAKNTVISIRPYTPADRAPLFKIAADTAFFGDPIEIYLEDRNVFLDLFYRYYTDFEPEHSWVAEANQQVIGFLTGGTDSTRQNRVFNQRLLPQFLALLLRGHYKMGPKSRAYLWQMVKARLKTKKSAIDAQKYPAHLHINVAQNWRNYGVGRKLMRTYFDQLIEENIPGVYLETSSENITACRLYESLGFQLIAHSPAEHWKKLVDHPVENRTYGLTFT
jgi:ribosomal protein S18 acetylase RimI-like enzyme